MKRFIALLFFLFSSGLFISSCRKKNSDAQIIHNCTGDYVKIKKNRYKVVNYEITENIPDGGIVRLRYTIEEPYEPFEEPLILCEMAYNFQSYITIHKIALL